MLYQANWWVKAAGEWAGYYPGCIGGWEPPECYYGWLFAANGLRPSASRLSWYGEVYDASAPAATSTDMGSGKFASAGFQHAAYFRNLTYVSDPILDLTQKINRWWQGGALSVTDVACYTGNGPFISKDPWWRNYFYFGGPGKSKEALKCQ
ncbi:MAG TPA: neprosin family prolyl endopeptidase [Candidatus Tectomicrobia bacterium]